MTLTFERLHNFRDLGGWPTRDGPKTRHGVLYRSDSLGVLAGNDLDQFRTLGVRTVIDLRYPWEIAAAGRFPDHDVAFHNLSIEHRPYDQTLVDADVDPVAFFAEKYAEVAEDGIEEIRQVIRLIAADAEVPLAFGCKSGKDRTGIIAALVLSLVGVSGDDVVAEFALSNLATPRFHEDHRNGGRELPAWPGFGTAPGQAMRQFLAMLDKNFGGPEGYVDLKPDVIDALEERLLG